MDRHDYPVEHPAVAEAAVISAPEEPRQFPAGKVARWQLPERWALVGERLETSVGKFDKKALRASYASGGVDVAATH